MTRDSLSPPSGQRASETTLRAPGTAERLTLSPGIYPDMPMADYFRVDGVNHSLLKEMFRSPAHFRYARTAPPSEPSAAMALGTAVHLLSLEPDLFGERVILGPINERTGECYGATTKAWREFAAEHPSKLVLSQADMDAAHAMAESIRRHPEAGRYARMKGRVEVTIVWDDPDTGIRCKGRVDKLIDGAPLGYDLKTTKDASPDAFARAVRDYGYYSQSAWYRRGLRVLGLGDIDIDLVLVENVPPYLPACGPIDNESIVIGETRCVAALRRIKRCEESGVWPGYNGDRLTEFGLSEWDKKRLGGPQEVSGE